MVLDEGARGGVPTTNVRQQQRRTGARARDLTTRGRRASRSARVPPGRARGTRESRRRAPPETRRDDRGPGGADALREGARGEGVRAGRSNRTRVQTTALSAPRESDSGRSDTVRPDRRPLAVVAPKPSVDCIAAPSLNRAADAEHASRSRQPWLRVRPPPRPRRVGVASRPRASVSTDAAPDRRRARSRKIFVLDAALAHRRSPSHPPPGTRAEDAKAKAAKAAKAVKRGTKGKLLKKRFSPTFHRYAPIAHRAAPAPLPRRHRPAADAKPANAPT